MNSVEAVRVLQVLDEGLEGLRLLSSVTQEVLESAGQVKDILDEDLGDVLVQHHAACQGSKSQDDGRLSALHLLRLLKKNASAQSKLQSLPVEPSPAMNDVIATFERLRACARKQLTTSVEEDNSNQEHFQEVKEREERAFAEKTQLEQKLKLQRIERHKQLSIITNAEERAKCELESTQTEAHDAQRSLEEEAAMTRNADNDDYTKRNQELTSELSAANAELQQLRGDHKEMEMELRKAKKRAEHDVEGVIHSFDKEMSAREHEYQEALGVYNELQNQITDYKQRTQDLTQERIEYEELQKKLELQRQQEAQRDFMLNRAAKTIQKTWKQFKSAKEAEKKKAKKEKGGKKGKK